MLPTLEGVISRRISLNFRADPDVARRAVPEPLEWEMSPLQIERVCAAFYEGSPQFPKGSVEFDCALIMRGVPHEWHELDHVPELAGMTEPESR